ncbi:error-prone DNA polymerase [Nocardiopsis mwathae]|uniref:DNA-directed DNA polymerase n=1 Tax=Nocardiopsis mwathae TaxID=1472723 RepID=A0A7W9YGP1_9ACTN|nr:PHP domain-containing protein [Nocardiopsis mwathae]MBB6171764.1 error-prone DNA polymerase [Nocardiopsis mwathae]
MPDAFTHLNVASSASMRYGTAHPPALAERAAELGMDMLALTDRDGVYGAVKHVRACEQAGIRPILGADLAVAAPDGGRITALARGKRGWASLCRLITAAHATGTRGVPSVTPDSVAEHADGLVILLGPGSDVGLAAADHHLQRARRLLDRWRAIADVAIELVDHYGPGRHRQATALLRLATETRTLAVLTNAARYPRAADAEVAHVLDEVHRRRPGVGGTPVPAVSQAYLKSGEEMAAVAERLCGPDRTAARRLLAHTRALASSCALDPAADLGLGRPHLPEFPDARDRLWRACGEGLTRLGLHRDQRARSRLARELEIIEGKGFSSYFLTVADIADRIRARGIRCSIRGSGAGSLVNHLIGISAVDPLAHGLLMERFLTESRSGLPDIDLDVESARRLEAYDAIFDAYPDAACVSMMETYRARSAIRDVGAVMGVPPHEVDRLAKMFPHIRARQIRAACDDLPELRAGGLDGPSASVLFQMAERLDGLPRHTALHPCGIVISDSSLRDRTPLEPGAIGYEMTQFDKNDVEEMGLIKLDVIGVRMQSAMTHALSEVRRTEGKKVDIDASATQRAEASTPVAGGPSVSAVQRVRSASAGGGTDASATQRAEASTPVAGGPSVSAVQRVRSASAGGGTDASATQRAEASTPVAGGPSVSAVQRVRSASAGGGTDASATQRAEASTPVAGGPSVSAVQRAGGTGIRDDDLVTIIADDPATYAMIRDSRTLGCFQIESPGQRELVSRLRPAGLGDLIVDISLFRPGPVNSDMITPYIAVRNGEQPPEFPSPALSDVLTETGGVVIFHEQVINVLHAMTGCGLDQAEAMRRRLGTDEGKEKVREIFTGLARDCGHPEDVVERVWEIIAAFGAFGFCKAHAAAFALPTYQSAWLKRYYPAAFYAGVLTHEPGMYPRRAILDDARRFGVPILGVDVNASDREWRMERTDGGVWGIRAALADVKGITDAEVEAITAGRPYFSLPDFANRARPARDVLDRLVRVGAFDALYHIGADPTAPSRRDLLLQAGAVERAGRRALGGGQLPIGLVEETSAGELPEMTMAEEVQTELEVLGYDASRHLLGCYAELIAELVSHHGAVLARDLHRARPGEDVLVLGVKVATQTPAVRSGQRIIFTTLDDATGLVDLTFFESVQDRCAATVFGSWLLAVRGRIRRVGGSGLPTINATHAYDLDELSQAWTDGGRESLHAHLGAAAPSSPLTGVGGRRIRYANGYELSTYADISPAGADSAPRKLWHASPGSSGR